MHPTPAHLLRPLFLESHSIYLFQRFSLPRKRRGKERRWRRSDLRKRSSVVVLVHGVPEEAGAREVLQLPRLVQGHSSSRFSPFAVLRHPRYLVRTHSPISRILAAFGFQFLRFDWTLQMCVLLVAAIEPSVTVNWSCTSMWLRTVTRRFRLNLRYFKRTSSKVCLLFTFYSLYFRFSCFDLSAFRICLIVMGAIRLVFHFYETVKFSTLSMIWVVPFSN